MKLPLIQELHLAGSFCDSIYLNDWTQIVLMMNKILHIQDSVTCWQQETNKLVFGKNVCLMVLFLWWLLVLCSTVTLRIGLIWQGSVGERIRPRNMMTRQDLILSITGELTVDDNQSIMYCSCKDTAYIHKVQQRLVTEKKCKGQHLHIGYIYTHILNANVVLLVILILKGEQVTQCIPVWHLLLIL